MAQEIKKPLINIGLLSKDFSIFDLAMEGDVPPVIYGRYTKVEINGNKVIFTIDEEPFDIEKIKGEIIEGLKGLQERINK